MATHSSILAWRIPWTEEPSGLQSMGSQRVGYDWATKHRCMHTAIYLAHIFVSLWSSMKWRSKLYLPFHFPFYVQFHWLMYGQSTVIIFEWMWLISTLKVKVLVTQLCLTLCNPMDCAHQAPRSREFSRQVYESELPFPSPEDLPHPGIEPGPPALQAEFFTILATREDPL